jgi:hypothetical protein
MLMTTYGDTGILLLKTQHHAKQSRRNNQDRISRTKNPRKSLIDGQGIARVTGFSETVVNKAAD